LPKERVRVERSEDGELRNLREVAKLLPPLLGNFDKLLETWPLSPEERSFLLKVRQELIDLAEQLTGFEN
jgi:hypothetical protein